MKQNLLFALMALMISVPVAYAQKSTTVIGKLEGSKAVLTADKAQLLKNYHANLQKMGITDRLFSDVHLVALENGHYMLVFSHKDYKSVFAVEREGEILYAKGTTACFTSDCVQELQGSIPQFEKDADFGICIPCSNGGKSTRIASSGSLLE
ncbi:hypothetical protein [Rhodoflexus caldus]|uniref:hypothetical protein n=1 Tax=Rhodoflexus caldus TaxID=2891236 RepID=UPI002029DD15|nr:hypothetical protein [Rhodoflexus caldus]